MDNSDDILTFYPAMAGRSYRVSYVRKEDVTVTQRLLNASDRERTSAKKKQAAELKKA